MTADNRKRKKIYSILGVSVCFLVLLTSCTLFQSKRNIVDWIDIPDVGTAVTYRETIVWYDGSTRQVSSEYILTDIFSTDTESSLRFVNSSGDAFFIVIDFTDDFIKQSKRTSDADTAPLFVLQTPIDTAADSYEINGSSYEITETNKSYLFQNSIIKDVVELEVTVRDNGTRVATQTVNWSKSLLLLKLKEESTQTGQYIKSYTLELTSFEAPQ